MTGFYKINLSLDTDNLIEKLRRVTWAVTVGFSLAVSTAFAQQAQVQPDDNAATDLTAATETAVADDASVILNFQDADIRGLINSISKLTGRNFIIDPRVRGNFTLVSGTPLDADQIYEVFLSVLDVHNLSAVPSGDIIKIVPSNVVRQQPTPTISSIEGVNRDEIVTYIYAVKNGAVQTILPIVQPLLPPTSYISAHAPSNSLIISGTAANIDRVLGIIERVDQPDTRSDINIVYLNNTKASKIAGVLSQIVANIQAQAAAEGRPAATTGVSIQPDDDINAIVIQAPDTIFQRAKQVIDKLDVQREGLQSDIYVVYTKHAKASRIADILSNLESSNEQQQNADGGDLPGQTISTSIQSDDSINAVIIKASYDRYLIMRSIIDQIDIPKPENAGNVHVAYLKHANAVDLAEVLNNILTEQAGGGDGEEGAAGTEGVEVSVQADENTNALIVRSEDTDFAEIKTIIEQLDIRRSQVYVEAIVAEVSENYSQSLGVQWQGVFNDQLSQGVLQGNTNFGLTQDVTNGAGGAGINIGFLSGQVIVNGTEIVPELSAVLNALRTDNNTNILSTPTVLTLENEEAELTVGQEVPFITSRTTDGTPATGDDGTTDSLIQNQDIERRDVGVKLIIKPQINEGDVIRLEIEQEVSNIAPIQLENASDIITDTRNIKTVTEVDNGQIVVLGGLTQEDFSDSVQRVPLISRIPVVGALFRQKEKTAVRRNLMVFLRPIIVDSHADIADTTQQKYLQLQEEELLSLPDTRLLIRDTEPPILPDIDWEKEKQRSR